MIYYLNIGTNLGNRQDNLRRAVASIERRLGTRCTCSRMVQSEPWGYESDNEYLNQGVKLSSTLQPLDLLLALQAVEREVGTGSHRDADGNYADRLIDIDIVAIDEQVIDSEGLHVPHEHLHERSFFLEPMAELAPEWRHPLLHLTAAELLAQLQHG